MTRMTSQQRRGGASATDSPEDTRVRILRAASRLFLQCGYRQTSLDAVGEAAGVTKPTVYSHFGSKQGLLLAMVEDMATQNATSLSQKLQPSGHTAGDLEAFGKLFLQRALSEQATRWRRLAMTESAEHPEVGSTVFASGPARVLQAISRFIQHETQAGRLQCADPEIAAEQFLGLLLGLTPIREMTAQPLPSKSIQQRRCRAAVTTFLAAYGTSLSQTEAR